LCLCLCTGDFKIMCEDLQIVDAASKHCKSVHLDLLFIDVNVTKSAVTNNAFILSYNTG